MAARAVESKAVDQVVAVTVVVGTVEAVMALEGLGSVAVGIQGKVAGARAVA